MRLDCDTRQGCQTFQGGPSTPLPGTLERTYQEENQAYEAAALDESMSQNPDAQSPANHGHPDTDGLG